MPEVMRESRLVDLALLPSLVSEPVTEISAVVMAGGFGTRLKPLTDETPKPMLRVGDKPLLERTINKLREASVTMPPPPGLARPCPGVDTGCLFRFRGKRRFPLLAGRPMPHLKVRLHESRHRYCPQQVCCSR